jgi:hypothetical protein
MCIRDRVETYRNKKGLQLKAFFVVAKALGLALASHLMQGRSNLF